MHTKIQSIQSNIEHLRQQIINHKVYSVVNEIEDLKIFMQYHVFAVWDFMSLLKSLQNNLTCTEVPWFPKGSAETRFLINEIVVGEESDIDLNGVRKSHFELYKDAMLQCGADTSSIDTFISTLLHTKDLNLALEKSNAPKEVVDFVNFTFRIINSKKAHLQSSIFTFGREDLIPGMFRSMVNDINSSFPENISIFKYYLDRHIEIDGDVHSHLALQMTSNLCSENDTFWEEAEIEVVNSLKSRIALWDGIYNAIVKSKSREELANL